MKHLFLALMLVVAATLQVHAQDDVKKDKTDSKDVPEAVRSAFDAKFDNAMMVDWKMKDGKYKASFTQGLKKRMAEFSTSGELISESEKIGKDELPTPVSDALKTNYSNSNIDEIYRVQKGSDTHFMVKMDNPKKKVIYDAQGKLIKEKSHANK